MISFYEFIHFIFLSQVTNCRPVKMTESKRIKLHRSDTQLIVTHAVQCFAADLSQQQWILKVKKLVYGYPHEKSIWRVKKSFYEFFFLTNFRTTEQNFEFNEWNKMS